MGTPANTATAYSNATDNIAVLKELYSDDSWVMKDLVFDKNPFLAIVPKDETEMGMGGKSFPVPVMYDTGAGRSAALGTAQTYQTAPQTVEFQCTRVSNYSVATLTNDFLRASASNIGAFMPAAELNVKAAFRNISNDLAHDLFLDGSGTRGSYGASGGSGSISSGVITLDNLGQVYQFAVGMALVSFSVSAQTPTQSTSAALGYVIAVDTSLGTVTVSASQGGAAGTPTNWSTTFPYLAQAGDVNFVSNGLASANMLKIAGLAAWIPTTAPGGSDNFFGVNRSVSPTKLAGLRFQNGASESIQDALIDCVNQLSAQSSEAGDPDYILINPVSYQTLVKQLTSQANYVSIKHDEIDISFKALVLPTANGEIAILQDRNCQSQTAWVITLKTWKLRSLGKVPQFLTFPGFYDQLGFPVAGSDAVELRVGYYAQLTCNAPGANAYCPLSQ
jgi:hypothetical protein